MIYKLFIDDERFPPSNTEGWIIARSLEEVIQIIHENGMPFYISFDHDMGENKPTGMDIAKLLITMDMDGKYTFPSHFMFYVHSQNPVGKENIESYLGSYLDFKSDQLAT